MAQYGSHVPKTDEYGNQVHTTGGGATMGEYGGAYQNQPSATAVTHGTGVTGHGHDVQHHGTTGAGTGILQRSGSSSSSSSSEDDGMGGRRKKKGVMEKIKEKLPGGGHGKAEEPMSTTTAAPYGGTEAPYGGTETGTYGHQGEHHEKKGMMDKIKEKLPGGHHQ